MQAGKLSAATIAAIANSSERRERIIVTMHKDIKALVRGQRLRGLTRRYADQKDAEQQAMFGVIKAAWRYDPLKPSKRTGLPVKPLTYCQMWMRAALQAGLREQGQHVIARPYDCLTAPMVHSETASDDGARFIESQADPFECDSEDREQWSADAERALAKMDPRDEQIFRLLGEGKKPGQIANMLGVSRQTILNRCRRGRRAVADESRKLWDTAV